MATLSLRPPNRLRHLSDLDENRVLVLPRGALTYAGFIDWVSSDDFPEKLRVTYFDGEVSIDMSEEAIGSHVAVKTAVYRTLLPLVSDEDWGEIYTDGILLCNEAAGVANNPDGAAVRWATIEVGRMSFITRKDLERAIQGSPDWVMEVLSNSSVHKDKRVLREAYHKAKITEYWLIDARGEDVRFDILLWRKNGYAAVSASDGWTKSKVFAREFRLRRDRNRRGAWTYTLDAR